MSIRTTLVLAIILSLIAGYFGLAQVRDFDLSSEEQPWFYTVTEEDIDRISINSDGAEQSFIKVPGQASGGWVFEDVHQIPVDYARWGGVTLLLSGPRTHRLFVEADHEGVDFGLESPQTVIDMRLRGGRDVRLSLGNWTPDRGYNYSINRGDERLYLVDASWGLVLGALATTPPYPEWYYNVGPERARTIIVNHEGEEASFFFELVSERWHISGERSVMAEPTYWADVYPHLGGPTDLQIVKESIGLDEFAQYGLDDPITVVTAVVAPPATVEEGARRIEMEIGSALEDGTGYYAKVRGQPYLLSVDTAWHDAMVNLILNPPPPDPEDQ